MMQTRERRRLWSCHLNEGCVGSTESIATKIARTFEMCSIRIHLRWPDASITRMSCAQKLSTRTAMYGTARHQNSRFDCVQIWLDFCRHL